MIITKNDELTIQVYDRIRANVVTEREGIHLSDLIYCTRKAYFRKKGLSPSPSNELCVLWMTGFAFQAYMFPNDEEIPVSVDGITCTPDVPSGIEVKSTRQSSKKFDLNTNEHWKRQILGYCKALNILEYDLTVLFICGNYAPPFPDIDCWHIVADPMEVEQNWNEVLEKKALLEVALSADVLPISNCESWEWEYCENIDMCTDTNCWKKKQLKGKGRKK